MMALLVGAGLAGGGLGGCTEAQGPRVVGSTDLTLKIPAMRDAVARKDLTVAPALVDSLRSDDPAVRFYSIEALEKLTGKTLGYRYWADDADRDSAVARWKQWLSGVNAQTGVASAADATAP